MGSRAKPGSSQGSSQDPEATDLVYQSDTVVAWLMILKVSAISKNTCGQTWTMSFGDSRLHIILYPVFFKIRSRRVFQIRPEDLLDIV